MHQIGHGGGEGKGALNCAGRSRFFIWILQAMQQPASTSLLLSVRKFNCGFENIYSDPSWGMVFRSCHGKFNMYALLFVKFSLFLDTFTFVLVYSSCHLSCHSFFFLVLLFTCASCTGKTR